MVRMLDGAAFRITRNSLARTCVVLAWRVPPEVRGGLVLKFGPNPRACPSTRFVRVLEHARTRCTSCQPDRPQILAMSGTQRLEVLGRQVINQAFLPNFFTSLSHVAYSSLNVLG